MPNPFDHRDVTFSSGGARQTALTHFDTLLRNENVFPSERVAMRIVNESGQADVTEHEVRLFAGPNGSGVLLARIAWRREATSASGEKQHTSRNDRGTLGNFQVELPDDPPQFIDTVNFEGGATLVVRSWAAVQGSGLQQAIDTSSGDLVVTLRRNGLVVFRARLSAG